MSTENKEKKSQFQIFREELEEDAKIDLTNLVSEMMKVTAIQAKWLNYYTIYYRSRIEIEKALKIARGNALTNLIHGTNGFSVTKSEANKLQNYDAKVIELEERLEKMDLYLRLFSEAQKIIHSKSFSLNNILRHKEFEAGMM